MAPPRLKASCSLLDTQCQEHLTSKACLSVAGIPAIHTSHCKLRDSQLNFLLLDVIILWQGLLGHGFDERDAKNSIILDLWFQLLDV